MYAGPVTIGEHTVCLILSDVAIHSRQSSPRHVIAVHSSGREGYNPNYISAALCRGCYSFLIVHELAGVTAMKLCFFTVYRSHKHPDEPISDETLLHHARRFASRSLLPASSCI